MGTPFRRNVFVNFYGNGKFVVTHDDGSTTYEEPTFTGHSVALGCTAIDLQSLKILVEMAENHEANARLPEYKCHKIVRAAEIIEINGYELKLGIPARRAVEGMPFENTITRTVEAKVLSRYTPVEGDFFVVYEDGYESISPRKAFLDGYARIE